MAPSAAAGIVDDTDSEVKDPLFDSGLATNNTITVGSNAADDADIEVEELIDIGQATNRTTFAKKIHGSSFISRASVTGTPTFFCDEHGNLKFVNLVCRRPLTVFGVLCILCAACISLLIQLNLASDNDFITIPNYDYMASDVRSLDFDSLRLAKKEIEDLYEDYRESLQDFVKDRLQEKPASVVYWIYDAKKSHGTFTKKGIKLMYDAEATIRKNEDYGKFCQLEYSVDDTGEEISSCRKPLTVINSFYASEWDSYIAQEIIDAFDSDPKNVDRFNAFGPCLLYNTGCDDYLSGYNETDLEWAELMNVKIDSIIKNWDGEGTLNPNIEQVTKFMAYLKALTIKNYHVSFFVDKNFSLENQVNMYSRSALFWGGNLKDSLDDSEESTTDLKEYVVDNLLDDWDDIQGKNHNDEVQSYYFMGEIIESIVLKYLSGDASKALGSFFLVFFYLRLMLGSWFLSSVGMFEIIMSLPLALLYFSYVLQIKNFGVVNVLVLFIVLAIGADDIFVFMDAYKLSASKGPEVLKSFETRMSWVYRRSGSAMLITSATTFVAFLCTLSTAIPSIRSFGIFAAFVILFDYLLVMSLFCTAVVIYHDRFENKICCCDCTFWEESSPTPTEIAIGNYQDGIEIPLDPISKIFKEKVGPFMLRGRNRAIIGFAMSIWIIVCSVFTFKLQESTQKEQNFKKSNPLEIGAKIISNEFAKTEQDSTIPVHFVWGLNEVNRDGVNRLFDPDDLGKASFSSDFVFNPQCQEAIVNACHSVRTRDDLKDFILAKDGISRVYCFMEELGTQRAEGITDCKNVKGFDFTNRTDWKIDDTTDLTTEMEIFRDRKSCDSPRKTMTEFYAPSMGWDGSKLLYAGLSIESSAFDSLSVLSRKDAMFQYDTFIQLGKDLDKTVKGACGTDVIMTDLEQQFTNMNTQKLLKQGAISGSLIGVLIAFIVVFVSTRKFHIALFASISIVSVLACVVGTVSMAGWDLGSIESILITILAGFSVDYIIHLAHAYNHAEGDCDDRITAAYEEMGISVFSGMLTSIIASMPLFFCTLVFFSKFGLFLCFTIVYSWIIANFGFMNLLASCKISMDRKWI